MLFALREGLWSLQRLLFSIGYKVCLRRGCFSPREVRLGEWNRTSALTTSWRNFFPACFFQLFV